MSSLKSIRQTFLPDPFCVFVKVDLSQIEDRMGKMYCGSKRMVELANTKPWEYDTHSDNAKLIFGKDSVTAQERYLGKKVVHASVDRRTEFLTERGFVFADRLTQWDKVAQWDIATEEITFTYPIELFAYKYTGKMYRYRTKFFSQYVTEDHRIPYQTNDRMKWAYAKDLPIGAQIPITGIYKGNTLLMADFVRLMIAYQADGTRLGDTGISWHLKKERKIAALIKILRNSAIDYTFLEGKEDDVYIRIYGSVVFALNYWLPDKKWTNRLLKLSPYSVQVLIEELHRWDGGCGNGCQYRSSDRENVDWIQIILHLNGYRGTLLSIKNSETSFSAQEESYSISYRKARFSIIQKKHTESKRDFPVYCLTVPKGYVVIRRNNCVSITGNSWRQMAGDKMSENVSKDTDGKVFIPAKDCQKLIDKFLAKNPEIEEIYFPFVRKQVQSVGVLYNSWGRCFDVRDQRIDADLYRKCYSFYPQSECADWTNQYGVRPGHFYMTARYGKPLNMQIHDEVVASVPVGEAYDFANFIRQAMEQTREIPRGSGLRVTIPVEIKVSTTLYGGVEFKRFPERKEFDKAIAEYLEKEQSNAKS